jgi:peptidoglycan L-alanyl-D-glutamate endopeptidase CwlK
MTYKLSARSYERLKGVDNRIFNIIELALTITAIDFGIPEYGGLRGAIMQKELFDKELSKCDGIEVKSEHQSGLAFDIYAYVDGKASWDRYHLTQVATALLQAASLLGYPLSWGGLWHGWQDMPHFQLEG